MFPEVRVDGAVSPEVGDWVRPSGWIWLRAEYVPGDPVSRPEPDGDMLGCPFHRVNPATSPIGDGAERLGIVIPDTAAFVAKAIAVGTSGATEPRSTV